MNLIRKLKKKKGFTMAEMMIVIGIIVALLGVSIPVISSITKRMNMTKMNEYATEVFLTSQNHLTNREISGTMDELPGQAYGGYYFLYKGSDFEKLVPAIALESEIQAGNYAIEFSKDSGTVIGAWYSTKSLPGASGLAGMSEKERNANGIGYYGGGDEVKVTTVQLPAPKINIVNGKELTVNLENWAQIVSAIKGRSGFADVAPVISTTVWQPDVSRRYEINLEADRPYELDSLDYHFSDAFPELIGGHDVYVSMTVSASVTAKKTGEGFTVLKSSQGTERTNSLFAYVSEEIPEETEPVERTAYIKNERHLQNLDGRFCTDPLIKYAVQKEDILWDDAGYDFISIANENLISYDGDGHSITSLDTMLFDSFGSISERGALSGIHLYNSKVTEGGDAVGALAGMVTNSDITHCSSTCWEGSRIPEISEERYIHSTATFTGGLIGSAFDCEINTCNAVYRRMTAKGQYIGGLFGQIDGCTISSCYSAIGDHYAQNSWYGYDVSGGKTGGIAGYATGSSVSKCYAVGHCQSYVDQQAVGLLGSSNASTIVSSYAGLHEEQFWVYNQNGELYYKAKKDKDKPIKPQYLTQTEVFDIDTVFGDGWTWLTESNRTHAISTICNSFVPYPYPALSAFNSHYGDWIHFTTTEMRIGSVFYDTILENEWKITDKNTTTFYVEQIPGTPYSGETEDTPEYLLGHTFFNECRLCGYSQNLGNSSLVWEVQTQTGNNNSWTTVTTADVVSVYDSNNKEIAYVMLQYPEYEKTGTVDGTEVNKLTGGILTVEAKDTGNESDSVLINVRCFSVFNEDRLTDLDRSKQFTISVFPKLKLDPLTQVKNRKDSSSVTFSCNRQENRYTAARLSPYNYKWASDKGSLSTVKGKPYSITLSMDADINSIWLTYGPYTAYGEGIYREWGDSIFCANFPSLMRDGYPKTLSGTRRNEYAFDTIVELGGADMDMSFNWAAPTFSFIVTLKTTSTWSSSGSGITLVNPPAKSASTDTGSFTYQLHPTAYSDSFKFTWDIDTQEKILWSYKDYAHSTAYGNVYVVGLTTTPDSSSPITQRTLTGDTLNLSANAHFPETKIDPSGRYTYTWEIVNYSEIGDYVGLAQNMGGNPGQETTGQGCVLRRKNGNDQTVTAKIRCTYTAIKHDGTDIIFSSLKKNGLVTTFDVLIPAVPSVVPCEAGDAEVIKELFGESNTDIMNTSLGEHLWLLRKDDRMYLKTSEVADINQFAFKAGYDTTRLIPDKKEKNGYVYFRLSTNASDEDIVCPITIQYGGIDALSTEEIQILNIASPVTVTKDQADSFQLDSRVEWQSSDRDVASVSAGLVRCKKQGTADITAEYGNFVRTPALVQLTVTEKLAPLELSPNTTTINQGDTVKITPNREVEDGSWSSSSSAVATVEDGVVTAVDGGTATITYGNETESATAEVTVRNPIVPITLTPSEDIVFYSATQQQKVTASTKVTWSVDNTAVAKIVDISDTECTVVPVGIGTTVLRAANSTETKTLNVTVQMLSTLAVEFASKEDDPQNVVAFSEITEWSIEPATVAAVELQQDNIFKITPVDSGTAVLTVIIGEETYSIQITVCGLSPSVLDITAEELAAGTTKTVTATDDVTEWKIVPENAVVSVSASGKAFTVTPLAAGTAELQAVIGDKTFSTQITVGILNPSVLSFTGEDVSSGTAKTVTAIADVTVTEWTIVQEGNVVSISSEGNKCTVTPLAAGTAELQAVIGERTYAVQVSVSALSPSVLSFTAEDITAGTMKAVTSIDNVSVWNIEQEEEVVSISSEGNKCTVTPLKAGTAELQAVIGENTYSVAITVEEEDNGEGTSEGGMPQPETMAENDMLTTQDVVLASVDAAPQKITAPENVLQWELSDEGVADIESSGPKSCIVTPKANGTAVLSAETSKNTYSVNIVVGTPALQNASLETGKAADELLTMQSPAPETGEAADGLLTVQSAVPETESESAETPIVQSAAPETGEAMDGSLTMQSATPETGDAADGTSEQNAVPEEQTSPKGQPEEEPIKQKDLPKEFVFKTNDTFIFEVPVSVTWIIDNEKIAEIVRPLPPEDEKDKEKEKEIQEEPFIGKKCEIRPLANGETVLRLVWGEKVYKIPIKVEFTVKDTANDPDAAAQEKEEKKEAEQDQKKTESSSETKEETGEESGKETDGQ